MLPGPLADRLQQVADVEVRHGDGLKSADVNAALIEAIRAANASQAGRAAAAAVAPPLEKGRELLTRVGNQSNLILDPDLDSYYTMSLVLLRYVELLELSNAVRERLDGVVAAQGSTAGDTRTQYLILEGRLDATAQAIAQDHAEAFAAGDPALRAALQPRLQALQQAVDGFRSASRRLIDASPRAAGDRQQARAALPAHVAAPGHGGAAAGRDPGDRHDGGALDRPAAVAPGERRGHRAPHR
jgi:hypothetical protein